MRTLPFARTGGTSLCRGRRIKTAMRSSSAWVAPESAAGSSSRAGDDAPPPPIVGGSISPVNTSLALSVHFRHPSLGMKDYEILSRATAFLLHVDPPDPNDEERTSSQEAVAKKTSMFPHLKENRDLRSRLLRKQDYRYDPATGPRRMPHQLNWLEFCPVAFRPRVHVVASSHVISPWMWPKYYGQEWLRAVNHEHVRYSLEVWGGDDDNDAPPGGESGRRIVAHDGKLRGDYRPLAKFALNPYPIHHPTGMDLAVIHLKDEDEALRLMKKLGISPLYLPAMHELEASEDPVFEPGERVLFQGFEVYEANRADHEALIGDKDNMAPDSGEDRRLFHPYSSLGVLAMASPDRFLARTEGGPLPEGLCGGPAIQLLSDATSADKSARDVPLTVRGVVEGIVPTHHESRELAGLASFIPSYRVREFVDFAERIMLEQIIDKDLFRKVVDLKEKKDRRGTTYGTGRNGEVHELNVNDNYASNDDDEDEDKLPDDLTLQASIEGTSEESDTPRIDREYQEIIASLREHHTPEEVDAILATVEREREEVIKIMETDGGDMDDVIEAVRRKTYEEKNRIFEEIKKEMMNQQKIAEGDIMSSKDGKTS